MRKPKGPNNFQRASVEPLRLFRYAPRGRPVLRLRVKKHPIIGSLLPPRETSHYAAHFTPKGDLCLSPTRVSFRTADFRLKQKVTKGERRKSRSCCSSGELYLTARFFCHSVAISAVCVIPSVAVFYFPSDVPVAHWAVSAQRLVEHVKNHN